VSQLSISSQATITGITNNQQTVITVSATGEVIKEPVLAAAATGSLTTRTDNTTGTLTMAAGHGITTGSTIDLYFSGGSRTSVTAGTVSGNSVPISSGSGSNLPALNAAVTAMVQVSQDFVVTGDNVQGFACFSPVPATVVFAQSGGTVIATINLTGTPSTYTWYTGSGVTNPLAGASVGKIKVTQSDATSTRTVQVGAIYN